MELRVLRYFLTVAREETISGAAEVLHVTQPTLSRQLIELEHSLGVSLFIRGKRKIILTDEGRLLRKRAEEILDLVSKTESELVSSEELIAGDIYIGGGETEGMRLIAGTVKALQKKHPQIRIHVFSGNAEDVTERLDKGLLDFGVLISPANIAKYNHLRLPAKDTWGVLMRKDCALAEKAYVTPADLWDLPLIGSRQRFVSGYLSEWMQRDYESCNIVATYNLIYNASLMVDEGMGYALCLDKLVNTSGASPLCFRPLKPRLEVGIELVWKKYQVFSKASECLLAHLEALCS